MRVLIERQYGLWWCAERGYVGWSGRTPEAAFLRWWFRSRRATHARPGPKYLGVFQRLSP